MTIQTIDVEDLQRRAAEYERRRAELLARAAEAQQRLDRASSLGEVIALGLAGLVTRAELEQLRHEAAQLQADVDAWKAARAELTTRRTGEHA